MHRLTVGRSGFVYAAGFYFFPQLIRYFYFKKMLSLYYVIQNLELMLCGSRSAT